MLAPIMHCLEYEDFLRAFVSKVSNSDDKEDLAGNETRMPCL